MPIDSYCQKSSRVGFVGKAASVFVNTAVFLSISFPYVITNKPCSSVVLTVSDVCPARIQPNFDLRI